jgi:Spy/CpxP family protein refolding chaperone
MKKLIIQSLALATIFGLGVSPSMAVTSVDTNARMQVKEARQEQVEAIREQNELKRQEVRTQVEEKVEEKRASVQERRAGIAMGHAERLTVRFQAYYDRLSAIIAKVEARLADLASQGIDVSVAQDQLGQVTAKLAEAQNIGATAVSGFASITPETIDNQKAQIEKARSDAQAARLLFVDTIKLLQQTVQTMRTLVSNQ